MVVPRGKNVRTVLMREIGLQSQVYHFDSRRKLEGTQAMKMKTRGEGAAIRMSKLTWLVLGEDPAARSHRVEQFTAL